MGKKIDLTGQRFGKWTVLGQVEEKGKRGRVVWKCVCECGKHRNVQEYSLQKGTSVSCGCSKVKDLTGKRFNNLTVIKLSKERRNGSAAWHCLCECGRETIVEASHLVRGNTKTCGCRNADISGEKYGLLSVIERSDRIDSWGNTWWKCVCDCGNTVETRRSGLINGGARSCGCSREEVMKKIHSHLEDTSWKEGTSLNQLNMKISSANKSGVKGVCWNKARNKWEATLTFKGQRVLNKCFTKKQDAIDARKEAEEKYFKPMLEKYGKEL